jgi:predicted PurR-regulated permease PerM
MYSKKVANYLLVAAVVSGTIFLHAYLGIFALAALTTLLFAPLHDWFLKKKGRLARLATSLTVVSIVFSLLIPLFTLVGISFYEANRLVQDVKENPPGQGREVDELLDNINKTTGSLGISFSKENFRNKIKDLSKKVIPGIVDFIFRTTGSIVSFFTSAIVYFMALVTMLSRKHELIRLFKRLSPFDDEIDSQYLSKVKGMAISMVKGTFLIALIVSAISSLTLLVIGFPYILFWFMLFTIMSLIPLGAGIIFVPIGLLELLTGNIWEGILILIVQFLILNNVDNVLRPRLAKKGSNLPAVLVLVSTFAGVSYYGILGVVYGPIIMVLIYATVELYDRYSASGIPMKRAVA